MGLQNRKQVTQLLFHLNSGFTYSIFAQVVTLGLPYLNRRIPDRRSRNRQENFWRDGQNKIVWDSKMKTKKKKKKEVFTQNQPRIFNFCYKILVFS